MNRRSFLAAAGAAGAAGCLTFEEGTETPGETVPGTTGGPDGTSGPETVGDGALSWTAETMASVDGAPIAGTETVYVHGGDRRLYAFDRTTGEQRWRTEIGSPPTGGAATARPILDDDHVITVTDGGVIALDRETGAESWSVAGRGSPLAAEPVAGDDLLVHRDGPDRARAVDRETGAVVARRTFERELLAADWREGTSRIVGLVGERGGTDCRLRVVSMVDGEAEAVNALPIAAAVERPNYLRVVDDVAVTDADGDSVAAFDVTTGDRLWRREHDPGVTPPVTVTDGAVYVKGFPEREVGEMAVGLRSGEVEWKLDLVGSGRCCSAAPAVADGRVYVPNTGDAGLVGVDGAGTVRWRYEGAATPAARPAVTDTSLFVPSRDGTLYAIER